MVSVNCDYRSNPLFRLISCLVSCGCTRVWIIDLLFVPRELRRAEYTKPTQFTHELDGGQQKNGQVLYLPGKRTIYYPIFKNFPGEHAPGPPTRYGPSGPSWIPIPLLAKSWIGPWTRRLQFCTVDHSLQSQIDTHT